MDLTKGEILDKLYKDGLFDGVSFTRKAVLEALEIYAKQQAIVFGNYVTVETTKYLTHLDSAIKGDMSDEDLYEEFLKTQARN